MSMSYLKRPTGLILLLILTLLALNISLKKPLCIETSIVDRIDRVTESFNESVHSCQYYRKTAFSLYFYENLNSFNRSLAKVESRLALQGTVGPQADVQITITVDESRPEALFLNSGGVTVGSKWLYTENFEQAVAKAYLRRRLSGSSPEFISFIDDYIHRREKVSLPARLLRESLEKLPWSERLKSERKVLQVLMQNNLKNKSKEKSVVESVRDSLSELKSVRLQSAFAARMGDYGFMTEEQMAEVRFDLVVELDSNESQDAQLEYLKNLALQNSERRIAVKVRSGLIILPSLQPVPRRFENRVQAQLRLVINDSVSTDLIQSYALNTQKLLVIRPRKNKTPDYRPLFSKDLRSFLRQNKELSFIQFDLTSFRLKSRDLAGVADYFKSFQISGLAVPELAESLGWQQTEWLKDVQAYKPVAVFEVVQYFRIN